MLPDKIFNHSDRLLLTPSVLNKFLQSEDQIIGNANSGQCLIIDKSLVPPDKTVIEYNINNFGNFIIPHITNQQGNIQIGGKNTIDQSQTINIEFNNCSDFLQGDLNTLAQSLLNLKDSDSQDIELAEELKKIASDLEEAAKEIPAEATIGSEKIEKVQSLLRKKGLINRLESLYDEFCDENSDLHKRIGKIRNGVKSLQKLGSHYNNISQWLGLPVIPKPLLGKFGK